MNCIKVFRNTNNFDGRKDVFYFISFSAETQCRCEKASRGFVSWSASLTKYLGSVDLQLLEEGLRRMRISITAFQSSHKYTDWCLPFAACINCQGEKLSGSLCSTPVFCHKKEEFIFFYHIGIIENPLINVEVIHAYIQILINYVLGALFILQILNSDIDEAVSNAVNLIIYIYGSITEFCFSFSPSSVSCT